MVFKLKRSSKKRGLFVLSLDGVPFTFLKEQMSKGILPYMKRLFEEGGFRRMNSVLPPISSVAWSSYMTGKNPAGHNIFGFIDRDPMSLKLFVPTGFNMKCKTIWERWSEEGKRVVVMNVPVTSPPRPINGILISGFLAPSIDKAVYPPSFIPVLKEWGYQIDVDVQRARVDRRFFLEDLKRTTQMRLKAAEWLMDQEDWDFFHLHIMGTDRINHYLWRRWEDGDPYFSPAFEEYYKSIDQFIGLSLIPFLESRKDTALMIMSDHGFCRLKKEVFLNTWLKDRGFLNLKSDRAKSVEDIEPNTKAYSLIPGRIYINLKGREPEGIVDPDKGYKALLENLKAGLLQLKDKETGERLIQAVYLRDEVYKGPYINQAPDMIALPENGYDIKGNVDQTDLVQETDMEGMHTFDDAFLFIRDHEIRADAFSILDITPTLMTLLGLHPYHDLDGHSLI
ncbi:alkaline phosphatase family protein [bacterium]|nr:alkaline phosphatase family protein [bacterium]